MRILPYTVGTHAHSVGNHGFIDASLLCECASRRSCRGCRGGFPRTHYLGLEFKTRERRRNQSVHCSLQQHRRSGGRYAHLYKGRSRLQHTRRVVTPTVEQYYFYELVCTLWYSCIECSFCIERRKSTDSRNDGGAYQCPRAASTNTSA